MRTPIKMNWKVAMAVCIGWFSAASAVAQNQGTVKISGIVYNDDNIHSPLSDVAIFNWRLAKGTISNSKGEFIIEMKQNDTLVFSTVQHMDEKFFFRKNQVFENQEVSIQLKTDTIFLNMISIMGNGNYEEFKRELLDMEMPEGDHSLALPVVNKYAEEYSTGEAAIKINGPLTYLYHKIRKLKKHRELYLVE